MRNGLWMAAGASEDNLWQQFINNIRNTLTDVAMWKATAMVLGRVLLIIIVSRIVLAIVNRIIDRLIIDKDHARLKLRSRRVQTVGRLLKNTAVYVINFIVILLILGEFNINLAPLIAGAGVLGLAIGFGAQSLVKDIITGFFIILEDHFSVGDVIQTGNYRGTVEVIGLRATRIRSWTGEVFILPNGAINDVTNFSVHNSLAVIDIPIASTDHLESVSEAVRGVLHKFQDPNLVGHADLLGVQTISAADIVLRVIAECRPNTQASVTRHLNAELKKAFEAERNPRYYKNEERALTGG
ncbi:mechanosensitive ion channel family protein [Cohnella pontilimi]|uniref:Mechanosensitive ion channel family protein n=1 Tax=Cohnella pontilimi TaxID=2564100 RepID=A0A4U0FA98_9BACL|nr:mechanosensitive ion channel family protein [Cohnella pontilimi]TJY41713.1 mechanosensitive ion channel family protein [Cohnella pontilimi]